MKPPTVGPIGGSSAFPNLPPVAKGFGAPGFDFTHDNLTIDLAPQIEAEVARIREIVRNGIDERVTALVVEHLRGRGYPVYAPPRPGDEVRLTGAAWKRMRLAGQVGTIVEVLVAPAAGLPTLHIRTHRGTYMGSLARSSPYAVDLIDPRDPTTDQQ